MLRQRHVWGWQSALFRHLCLIGLDCEQTWNEAMSNSSCLVCCAAISTHICGLQHHRLCIKQWLVLWCPLYYLFKPCTTSLMVIDANLSCQAELDHLTICANLNRPASILCRGMSGVLFQKGVQQHSAMVMMMHLLVIRRFYVLCTVPLLKSIVQAPSTRRYPYHYLWWLWLWLCGGDLLLYLVHCLMLELCVLLVGLPKSPHVHPTSAIEDLTQ